LLSARAEYINLEQSDFRHRLTLADILTQAQVSRLGAECPFSKSDPRGFLRGVGPFAGFCRATFSMLSSPTSLLCWLSANSPMSREQANLFFQVRGAALRTRLDPSSRRI
jgi:hypothetical protein